MIENPPIIFIFYILTHWVLVFLAGGGTDSKGILLSTIAAPIERLRQNFSSLGDNRIRWQFFVAPGKCWSSKKRLFKTKNNYFLDQRLQRTVCLRNYYDSYQNFFSIHTKFLIIYKMFTATSFRLSAATVSLKALLSKIRLMVFSLSWTQCSEGKKFCYLLFNWK